MGSHILVTGATGLIGSAVVARLAGEGHELTAVVRAQDRAARRLPVRRTVTVDIAHAGRIEGWLPLLRGIDAVVNCAGVLQDSPRDSTAGVHVNGIDALFAACERAGVRRVIHLSAIGVDRETPTSFSRTKLQGDQALMARDLDWIILRPSVVVGRPAYGGSALFRGLAALPILPVMPETGPLQIVQLDDVTQTVARCLAADAPARMVLELVGPARLSMSDVVAAYRRWLGWRPAPAIRLPRWLAAAAFRTGDLIGLLGWRVPMRETARLEMRRGAVGDASAWQRATGIVPRALDAALAAEPASVQEHWFAQLYLLKPAVLGGLALFWMATGLITLGPGFREGVRLMQEAGAGATAAATVVVVAGALADLAIGLAIAFRRTARAALWAALAVTAFYLVAGSILLPRLWVEPLGPLLKAVPIAILNLVALAILDDR
jgi:uncharacterized protein YbjT (DUF2867 family)